MVWGSRAAYVAALCLVLGTSSGCSRQTTIEAATANAESPKEAPFERISTPGGRFPTGWLAPASVPAGAILTVRMHAALSSATALPGDSFDCVLDAPLMVQDQVVAPAGSTLAGTVVSARASQGVDDPGYLRVTLTSISIHGKKLPLETSSLFAKASPYPREPRPAIALVGAASRPALSGATETINVVIPSDRKLVFRLIQPLPLHAEMGVGPSE
jgi:hypothetical protein